MAEQKGGDASGAPRNSAPHDDSPRDSGASHNNAPRSDVASNSAPRNRVPHDSSAPRNRAPRNDSPRDSGASHNNAPRSDVASNSAPRNRVPHDSSAPRNSDAPGNSATRNDTLLSARASADERQENALRPQRLREFIGQEEMAANLRVFIGATKKRVEALDHVLLSGPPGLGKTTLAAIIATELEVPFKISAAPSIEKPKDIAGLLTAQSERAVIFIDEIHRLRPAIEEMLYGAMEDYRLDWVIGQGPTARTVSIDLPRYTLIGATTRVGAISSPMASRFGIHLRLEYYRPEDIATILMRSAQILNIALEGDAALAIAHSSRGTPRIANRLLKRVRDYAEHANQRAITRPIAEESLRKLGIEAEGLDEMDRGILRTIIQNFGGGPVGLKSLAIALSESEESLEEYYEPYLIRKGLMQRTAQGRIVTASGYRLLGFPLSGQRDLSL